MAIEKDSIRKYNSIKINIIIKKSNKVKRKNWSKSGTNKNIEKDRHKLIKLTQA